MSLLGLHLGHLLDDVLGTVDDVLGGSAGVKLGHILPGNLLDTLGSSLDGLLKGGSTDLLDDLLSNNLIDKNLLSTILSGDKLNLDSLDGLLSGGTGPLGDILDNVFDDGLLGLGDTVLNLDGLLDLNGGQLNEVITVVTSLIGTILKAVGDPLDINDALDDLLATDDNLKGDGGDNKIDGRGGDDTIKGLGGDDTLIGGSGHDVLKGGGGDDLLIGGQDADILFGGKGSDIFQFDEGDAGRGANMHDIVRDFGKQDFLSFKPLPGHADFIGKEHFSGDGDTEISYGFKKNMTVVKIDIDGDGHKDMQIDLSGHMDLKGSDFIL